jgi:hypothetical protein
LKDPELLELLGLLRCEQEPDIGQFLQMEEVTLSSRKIPVQTLGPSVDIGVTVSSALMDVCGTMLRV